MRPNQDPTQSVSAAAFAKEASLPITDDLKEEFLRFVDFHSAAGFSRNLRKMLLEFLSYEGALEAVYLRDLLYDLDGLFDLLDAMQKAQGPAPKN